MTRIITIASGTPQAGRSQLAINLAVELVRRGRQSGVFQDTGAAHVLEEQLDLQHFSVPHRRASDEPASDVMRRGYQGADFLTCRLPLSAWATCEEARLKACIHDMDTHDGYDELLVDTSGMEPGAVLGCCLAAAAVVLVVTPDAHAQAETFALLRILKLNGFTGQLHLLVNRATDAGEAAAVHARLNAQLREHLGMEIPLLGGLAEDRCVGTALRSRQAWSSVYPDSAAVSTLVAITDALDSAAIPAAPGRQTVTRFWKTYLEKVRAPLQLPGRLTLAELPETNGDAGGETAAPVMETGLVQFDGSLGLLCGTLVTLPETLGVLAHDMRELVAALAQRQTPHALRPEEVCDERECLRLAAAILNGICASATRREHVNLQITECRIDADNANWLHGGDYIRFAFRVGTQGDLLERLRAVFTRLRLPLREQLHDDEVLWERTNPTRSVSLGVSVSLPDELRLVLWVPGRREVAGAGDVPAVAGR